MLEGNSECGSLPGPWRIYVRTMVVVLAVLFGLGALGHLLSATKPLVLRLTPHFSLLVGMLVLAPMLAAGGWRFGVWAVGTYVFILLLDIAGVATGTIFGPYRYGATLGWKWQGVPLLIGLNWMLILHAAVCLSCQWKPLHSSRGSTWLIRILLTALIVLGFALLMEPTAMRLDYWQWENDKVPLQNYAVVVFFAAVLAGFHPHIRARGHNLGTAGRLAVFYLGLQMVFFAVLNLGQPWLE